MKGIVGAIKIGLHNATPKSDVLFNGGAHAREILNNHRNEKICDLTENI
jgi:hypothetical protein